MAAAVVERKGGVVVPVPAVAAAEGRFGEGSGVGGGGLQRVELDVRGGEEVAHAVPLGVGVRIAQVQLREHHPHHHAAADADAVVVHVVEALVCAMMGPERVSGRFRALYQGPSASLGIERQWGIQHWPP